MVVLERVIVTNSDVFSATATMIVAVGLSRAVTDDAIVITGTLLSAEMINPGASQD